MHWMHFRPLNPKHVIEESLLEEFYNVLAKKIGILSLTVQAPVVQTMDSAIHRINRYPLDK